MPRPTGCSPSPAASPTTAAPSCSSPIGCARSWSPPIASPCSATGWSSARRLPSATAPAARSPMRWSARSCPGRTDEHSDRPGRRRLEGLRVGRLAVDRLEVRAGEVLGVAGVDGNGQVELELALTGLAIAGGRHDHRRRRRRLRTAPAAAGCDGYRLHPVGPPRPRPRRQHALRREPRPRPHDMAASAARRRRRRAWPPGR